jgi:hypothetical protein
VQRPRHTTELPKVGTDFGTELSGTGPEGEGPAGTAEGKNPARSIPANTERDPLGRQQRFTKPLLYR